MLVLLVCLVLTTLHFGLVSKHLLTFHSSTSHQLLLVLTVSHQSSLTTVDVTGGIGLDLKNWVKKVDADGNTVTDANGDPVLEEAYSVATGTVLTIDTKAKKLFNGSEELLILLHSLHKKLEFMKAGGSYAVLSVRNYKHSLLKL